MQPVASITCLLIVLLAYNSVHGSDGNKNRKGADSQKKPISVNPLIYRPVVYDGRSTIRPSVGSAKHYESSNKNVGSNVRKSAKGPDTNTLSDEDFPPL